MTVDGLETALSVSVALYTIVCFRAVPHLTIFLGIVNEASKINQEVM